MRGYRNLSSFLLIGAALLVCLSYAGILATPRPTGYEISIYQQTPIWMWVAIAAALGLVIATPLTGEVRFAHWFGILTSIVVLLLSLPWLRGYVQFLAADAFYHVGVVRGIATTGHIPDHIFYPALHILTASLVDITGVANSSVVLPLLLTFSTVGILSSYLIIRHVLGTQESSVAAWAIASILLLQASSTYFAPWPQALALYPLILYVFMVGFGEYRKERYTIALLLVTASVFFHPLFYLIVLLAVAILFIASKLLAGANFSEQPSERYSRLTIFSGVVFAAWVTSLNSFLRRSADPILAISAVVFGSGPTDASSGGSAGAGGQSYIDMVIHILTTASPRLSDLLEIAVFRYGRAGAIIMATMLMSIAAFSTQRVRETSKYYAIFVLLVPAYLGFASAVMFLPLPFGFGRLLTLTAVVGSLVVGIEYFKAGGLTREMTLRNVVIFTAVVGVVFAVGITPFVMYNSTHNTHANKQVTEMELEGTQWFMEMRVPETDTVSFGITLRRYTALLNGGSSTLYDRQPPEHFGYQTNGEGPWTQSADYLFLTKEGKMIYPAFYPDYRDRWAYTPRDFDRLDEDPRSGRIYANGEVWVYTAT